MANLEAKAQLEAKYGPVWVDRDGNLWPVVLMSERRLCGIHKFLLKSIRFEEVSADYNDAAYAAYCDDHDDIWPTVSTPNTEDMERWRAIIEDEMGKRGLPIPATYPEVEAVEAKFVRLLRSRL